MKSIITTFNAVKNNSYRLSASLNSRQHKIENTNLIPLEDLLSRNLGRDDLGKEIGSINYVNRSNIFFIKTKALQDYSFLPVINAESTECILPQAFVNQNLTAGDIILSKDSNIGEIVILDKDYPNHMLSGALYKLPLHEDNKYYILAFIKHRYFRTQLDSMVPRGATLRHAGTKFLKCLIPFPTANAEKAISYVSSVTKKIIDIEIEIKNRYNLINTLIESEIEDNQRLDKDYRFSYPSYSDILRDKRLDTGIYSPTFKRVDHLLRNYINGYFSIEEDNLKSGNTPKIREITEYDNNSIRWITPTNCSDFGYIQTYEKISTPSKNNLNESAVLLTNRTSRGGKGEYVGIGTFYDFETYGKGYHNQGIYRITGYDKKLLSFITCFMNTPMMRRYCAALSVGSKMKEIKSDQFLSIPIPEFPEDKLNRIYTLFYTENFCNDIRDIMTCPLNQLGLFHLGISKHLLTAHLNDTLDQIVSGTDLKL